DLILAGTAFFDSEVMVAPRQQNTWTLNTLWPKMEALAQPLGASAALEQAGASQPVRWQIEDRMHRIFDAVHEVAQEALARVAREAGFVEQVEVTSEQYQQALAPARTGVVSSVSTSLPALLSYRSNDQPLTVRIPLRWLGAEDYARVAHTYRRGVLA